MANHRLLTAALLAPLIWSTFSTWAVAEESEFVQPAANQPAAPASSEFQPQWPEPPNIGAMFTRLAITTLLVIGVCVGTLWFGRRWLSSHSLTSNTASKQIIIRESVALDARSRLHLVQIEQCRVLVATDTTGLKSVTALPEQFEDVLAAQSEEAAMPSEETTPSRTTRPNIDLHRSWDRANHQAKVSEVSHV